VLKAWTCPLDADSGPAQISLDIISGDGGVDLAPSDARRIAEVLIKFNDRITGRGSTA
jgi:hypothetical protein